MRRSRGDRPTERSRGTRDPTEVFADGRFVADKLAVELIALLSFVGLERLPMLLMAVSATISSRALFLRLYQVPL